MTCPDCERYKQSASMWRNKAYELNGTPLPWKPRLDQGPDYERGFIDGMQKQMQSSVDKAVNRMAQPAPVLTGIDCSCGRKWRVVNNTLTATEQPEYQSTADKSKLEKVPAKGTLLAQPEQFCGFDVVLDESMPPNTFKLAQPEQEPVAECVDDGEGGVYYRTIKKHIGFLYITPPQRTWVGLTDEEIDDIAAFHGLDYMSYAPFTKAIEAKLKEKNT